MAVTTTKIKEGQDEVWKLTGFATNADASAWIKVPKQCYRSIHAFGTFAGSISLQVQGSNESDQVTPTSGIGLRSINGGSAIAITAAGLLAVLEQTEWVRVIATAGSGGANVTVYLKFLRGF